MVLPQNLERTEMHLNDAHRVVGERELWTQCRRLDYIWISTEEAAGLDIKFFCGLMSDSPKNTVLFSLIETYKLSPTDDTRLMMTKESRIRRIVAA